MNEIEKLIQERLAKIDTAGAELRALAATLQQGLYEVLLNQYDSIVDDFTKFYAIYAAFAEEQYIPFVQEVVTTFRDVRVWNAQYFRAQQVGRLATINERVIARLYDTYGLNANGTLIPGGFFDGVKNHPGPKQNVADFLFREFTVNRPKPVAVKELSRLVRGEGTEPGQYEMLLDQFVYDRLQEADRITQVVYADELGLQAAYYSGGIVDGSRPFCKERSGKVFLVSEIKKFGTSADAYGGYTDKALGLFKGRPRTGYNPEVQLGGVRCRHTLGHIANRTALRLRPDLKEVNGILMLK